ncbi:hypothetical protein QBC44DRAFT_332337 [Cladorrhinum sp. PSN332]|nr:hypothetical protein QBC44DRAFT_332337 [Cladorrhinum sp. PSN332]
MADETLAQVLPPTASGNTESNQGSPTATALEESPVIHVLNQATDRDQGESEGKDEEQKQEHQHKHDKQPGDLEDLPYNDNQNHHEKALLERHAASPLLQKIRALQARLSQLERFAAQEEGQGASKDGVDIAREAIQAPKSWDREEKRLRKEIRRARWAKKAAQKTVERAERSREQRVNYAYNGPPHMRDVDNHGAVARNKRLHNYERDERVPDKHVWGNDPLVDNDETAEYKVEKSEGHAPNDFATVREEQLWAEWNSSDDQATFNHPKRALRPPTSLRPVYSRKLGPPTQWDTSDSDEWSDGSTRSRDFDYFRARLRGDFEWELDRLHAQRERYMRHKEKKRAEELREKVKAEREKVEAEREKLEAEQRHKAELEKRTEDENLGQAANGEASTGVGTTEADTSEGRPANVETAETLGQAIDQAATTTTEAEQEPGTQTKGEEAPGTPNPITVELPQYAVAKLNPVRWAEFAASRQLPESSSFVIDILTGEPIITVGWQDKRADGVKAKRMQVTKPRSLIDGQEPLPERIRINSSYLVTVLSSIHGSAIQPYHPETKNESLVLLRPFRILIHYEKEVRDLYGRLASDLAEGKKPSPESSEPNVASQAAETPFMEDRTRSKEEENRSELEQRVREGTSTTTLAHLRCLVEFYDTYLSRKAEYLISSACDQISFPDIWHLYKPGDFVISSNGKQAYRVVSVSSPQHKGVSRRELYYQAIAGLSQGKSSTQDQISIVCVYIHYNGERLGPVTETFEIPRFDGERSLSSLNIYPLRYHASKLLHEPSMKAKKDGQGVMAEDAIDVQFAKLKAYLVTRGKMFVDVAAVKHMYYAGLTADTRDEVESQVVIDFEEAFATPLARKQKWRPEVSALAGIEGEQQQRNRETRKPGCLADCCRHENVHDDDYIDVNRSNKFREDFMTEIEDNPHKLPSVTIYPRSLEDTKPGVNALREEELVTMSYCVFGYILRDRTWAQLDLTHIEPINTGTSDDEGIAVDETDADSDSSDDEVDDDNSTFGRLVLPKGHKKLILSLIAQHFRNKGAPDEQADIVRGKGKGLIILLHGAPGVGKTTTAEGVAERFRKPLFQITCGDLGSDAKEVESALQTNFALANRWGCILLLDEADVFLASRRREDFTRNGLVAVFLRVLEYYAGILFLTTNRIGDFDEAFASRIHMSLHYPALDKISTMKVFKLNLSIIRQRYDVKGRKIRIEEDEILLDVGDYFDKNKEARWNGRQIRNACQTALALAEFDAQPRGKKYDIKTKSAARVHLRVLHLEVVSKAYLEFLQYLKEVHGTDAETYAKETGTRALETVIATIKAGKGIPDREDKLLTKFKLKGSKSPVPPATDQDNE